MRDGTKGTPGGQRSRRERLLLWGWVAALVVFLTIVELVEGVPLAWIPGAATVVVLCVWNRATQIFISGATPFLAQGMVYELTGPIHRLIGSRPIHIAGPYLLEKEWFAIKTVAGVLTPNEFFARHHWPLLDLICGSTYILYIYEVLALLLFLSFTRHRPGRKSLLRRFGWAFFAMSVAGYLIYQLFPAAPPWYVTQHGFATPNGPVQASPAAAIRWDMLTGVPYFQHFYHLTTDVFGAIPSLHVAYALLVFAYATELRKRWLSTLSLALYLTMCVAAVYLQHHYIIDVLAGTFLAFGVRAAEVGVTSAIHHWRPRPALAPIAASR